MFQRNLTGRLSLMLAILFIVGCAVDSAPVELSQSHPARAAAEPSQPDDIASVLNIPPGQAGANVAQTQPATPDEAVRYVCPMHPEVNQASPGKCPVCHMSLRPTASKGGSR